MHDKLRWGFLGTARIADRLARAVRASGNGELVAVASRDIEKARQWAAERGVPTALGSYDLLIESHDVEAIYNPLPNSMHLEWTVRAARAGKHILCEKPLAMNAAEAAQMTEAAERQHVLLMEAFMYRFHPQYAQLDVLLASGRIGEPRVISAAFGHHLRQPEDFRWVRHLGGGALLDVGCYAVNAARRIVGAEPTAVQAAATWYAGGSIDGVDETLTGLLELPGGILAEIEASFRTMFHQMLVIRGTEGTLTVREPFVNGDQPVEIELSAGDYEETIRIPGADKYALMVRAFGQAALRGEISPYPAEDSVRQMRVLDALDEAARGATRIEL